MNKRALFASILLFVAGISFSQSWKPVGDKLMTPWTEKVNPANPLPEYPRPQMEREEWMNLNGLWNYTIKSVDFEPVQGLTTASSWTTGEIPDKWTGDILVPFSIDAPLSGVGHILRYNEILWYQRSFKIPETWKGKNVLLHFESSDWETSVYVNGKRIGQHRGGYDPFSYDITSYLKSGENTLNVCVWDATENQCQAIGKQIMPENRQGFRYQPTGGIWKTVWMEPVSDGSVENLKITPQYDQASLRLNVKTRNSEGNVLAQVWKDGKMITETAGTPGTDFDIPMKGFEAWSPSFPVLYDLKVFVKDQGKVVDEVNSYFGMRKIEIKKASDGFQRIYLNNEQVFQYGPLDQGYWPDGVLTPPTEEAIKYDLEYLKSIGCNMVRVHIKTHPDRWYYQADKLGLLVWQDMTCMPKYGQNVDDAAAKQWHAEYKSMVDWLYNHPSIVMWIVFNEGWSQHNTEFYTNWIDQYDPSRLINCASGWDDYPVGDIVDIHDYTFYPRNNAADFKLKGKRALVIGEAAGVNLAIPGHTWYSDTNKPEKKNHQNYIPVDNYSFEVEAGRHTYGSPEAFEEAYRKFIESIRCLNAGGGCDALVYTQISDVEHELNGYLTYDRKVSKIKPEVMKEINEGLYSPPELKTVIPFSSEWESSKAETVRLPAGETNEFIPVKTQMKAPFEISKTFELEEIPNELVVSLKGFTGCEIRINGKLFRKTKMSTQGGEPGIEFFPFYDNESDMLVKGKNVISVSSDKKIKTELLDVAVFLSLNKN
ncbi:glycoside hydrolase family 2 protein [Sunxiuqinia sp. A32]|uniref:glycoside hydrolase family 2 protein n=1 Tax=Sunxiuqinia sp. A32 TaxID=3461496 RepID=UPI0040457151